MNGYEQVEIEDLKKKVNALLTKNKILMDAVASAIKMAQEHHLTEATVYFQEVCERVQGRTG